MATIPARLRTRRGTGAQWISANPILGLGEMGWETDAVPPKGKMGDGTTAWNSLAYTLGGSTTTTSGTSSASGGLNGVSTADVDNFIAPNAAAKLAITVPAAYSDANNEVVEPSVWYDQDGLFGYEYWMAAGPYKGSSSVYEVPCVWVSHDGITWVVPPGGSNPVVSAPGSGNYDDPHLFEKDGSLHLIWNYTRGGGLADQVLYSHTENGTTWATPVVIRTGTAGGSGEYVSPHMEYHDTDGLWYMWTLNNTGTRAMYLSTATSITATWTTPVVCTTPLPTGKDLWEFEIRRVGSEWWMLQCVVDTGGTAAGGQLRFRTSTDGLIWNLSRRPVIGGDNVGPTTKFDANFIYKPSFVPLLDGRMAIWYSAGGSPGGTLRWAIGYTVAEKPKRDVLNTGSWYGPPATVGTGLMTDQTVYYLPVFFDRSVSLQTLALEVTVVGSAGSVINLGLYDDNGFNAPGRLIVDAGQIVGTAVAIATRSVSQTIGPGVVWLAALSTGAPTTNPTVRMATSPTGVPLGASTSTLASQNNLVGHRQTGQTVLPALAGVNRSLASTNIPRLVWQVT